MKKMTLVTLALLGLLNVAAMFTSFNYLDADQFKGWLDTGRPVIIADIQVEDEFAAHHFPASIETNAFPVKSDVERKMIDQVVAAYQQSGHDVVVVCPRGGGGAKRSYSYLESQGVPAEKLTILRGGVAKWPYRDMLASGK
jgi:rhodanese-related sulfurtransferase